MIALPHLGQRGPEIWVAKREGSRQDTALPHVSLRQAVRPVIVAHGILSSEQLAVSALADEAKTLCELTEELLRKLGRVHLLTASSTGLPGDPEQADTANRLIEAYAQAGMSWARVLSSVNTLADLLIGVCDWAAVRLIADLLAEAGETAVSKHIERVLTEAQDARFRAQLVAIRAHPAMAAAEIRAAVTGLSSMPTHPERKQAIIDRRMHLVTSVRTIASSSGVEPAKALASALWTKADRLARRPDWEDSEDAKLAENKLFPEILTILDLCGA